jgi:DNA polymerase III alpha subunit
MNNEVKRIFYERAKIVANLDKIISAAKKSNSNNGQLSLFAEEHVDIEISLDEPVDFDPLKMAIAEKNALGFSMLYSQFDEYFMVQCRYCNSNIASLLMGIESTDLMTMLAEIKAIEYRTSQYGNKYAKITFADQTGEDKMYLFGRLYLRMIAKCFIGRIYLLTVKKSEEGKIDIINFMLTDEIPDVSKTSNELHVVTTTEHLPVLRMYLKSYMMGDKTSVSVTLTDLDMEIPDVEKVLIDNTNLLEMSKQGFELKLK